MSPTKLLIAAALVIAGTSASMAQGYYTPWAPGYTYDYAPGYYAAPYDGPGYFANDVNRGGPGPRVQDGSGMGIGAVR